MLESTCGNGNRLILPSVLTLQPDAEDVDVAERDEEEEALIQRVKQNEIPQEEEDEFARELAKMMSDSGESRKAERKAAPVFDVGLPVFRKNEEKVFDSEEAGDPNKMKFTLLTKKGNKQQVSLRLHPPTQPDLRFLQQRRGPWRFRWKQPSLCIHDRSRSRARPNRNT
jgi:hypothetical protein